MESLVRFGCFVRVFDRINVDDKNIASFKGNLEMFYGDVSNQLDIERAMIGIDYVFHFAGGANPKSSADDPIFDIESNVIGSLKILESACKNKCRKVVYASSGGTVYGIPEKLPINEEHPTQPISAYGVSKLFVENYFKLYQYMYNLDYIILRIANPYGPRQNINNSQGAIAHFLNSIKNGHQIEIWGDGSVVRDYLYVEDLITLFPKLLSNDVKNEIYNIGHGNGFSLNDVLHAISEVLDITPKVVYSESRKLDIPVNYLCVEKARRELKWCSTTDLVPGISRMWQRMNA
ncbi:MAG: NAD-dependent epimerase/dehydratase family protein [Geobacteraceae bacterium]|nr:NAD-dependent epimerase/dehydratase family protein [Geobacteraceae bacterium]NTW79525.1 NAD-dependent epimerase/dehydratase family protein [Geobacteraceae bacterium]